MPTRYFICLFILLGLNAPAFAQYRAITPFVISGVVADSAAANSIKHFVRYLGQKSGSDFEIHYAENYTELSTVMNENPSAIGWSGSVSYVEDAQSNRQQLVSVPLFNNKPNHFSLLIAPLNSRKKNLAEFRDKIFIYSDNRSHSGYIVPAVLLKKQRIDIKNHFDLLIKSGNHENSITALMNGMGDVASVDEYVWVEYVKRNPQVLAELQEIKRTGPYPFSPVVAANGVTKQKIRALREALADMKNTEEGKHILGNLGLDGFSNKPEFFFKPVKDMLNFIGNDESYD